MPRHQPSRLLALAAVAAASAHGALAQSRRLLAPDDMNGARRSILLAQNCSDAATPCQHWGASKIWRRRPRRRAKHYNRCIALSLRRRRPAGTCDVISGRCQCPPGYGGTLCSDLLYPACRHTVKPGPNGEPPAMSCTFVGAAPKDSFQSPEWPPALPRPALDRRPRAYLPAPAPQARSPASATGSATSARSSRTTARRATASRAAPCPPRSSSRRSQRRTRRGSPTTKTGWRAPSAFFCRLLLALLSPASISYARRWRVERSMLLVLLSRWVGSCRSFRGRRSRRRR